MLKKISLILCALLITPLLVNGVVVAHAGHDETEKTEAVELPKTGNEGLTLQQRAEKYKAANKTRLDNALKARLKERCKASQGAAISSLNQRVAGLLNSRQEKYTQLQERMTKLSTKLQAKGVDTTELDKEAAQLKTLTDTYLTDLAKYHEALDDLKNIDCATDPEAFKAALETTRSLRAQVVKDGSAVRTYVTGTIAPTLQTIRQQLKDKPGGEE
jgi:hypothetical protein